VDECGDFSIGGAGGDGAGGARNVWSDPHPNDNCRVDSDCTDGDECVTIYNGGLGIWTFCVNLCHDDAECGDGWVCDCLTHHCTEAQCRSDADCGEGLCIASTYFLGATRGEPGYACQSAKDKCFEQDDCLPNDTGTNETAYCAQEGEVRECVLGPNSEF
jgi:hypothetical protein